MRNGEYQNIKIEREDAITFVMLNRPEKRNAMSPALHYEMGSGFRWWQKS
jgi:feruloyl-CoA hydratase/lyase